MKTENEPIDWPVGRIAGLMPGTVDEGKGANAFGGHAIAIHFYDKPILLMAQDIDTLAKAWEAISHKDLDESRIYPAALVNPAIFEYMAPPPPAAEEAEDDVIDVEPKAEVQEPPVGDQPESTAPVDDDDDL